MTNKESQWLRTEASLPVKSSLVPGTNVPSVLLLFLHARHTLKLRMAHWVLLSVFLGTNPFEYCFNILIEVTVWPNRCSFSLGFLEEFGFSFSLSSSHSTIISLRIGVIPQELHWYPDFQLFRRSSLESLCSSSSKKPTSLSSKATN